MNPLESSGVYTSAQIRHSSGWKLTQIDIKDGEPYAAWSVFHDDSGRVRYKRLWTLGQKESPRVRWVISEWKNPRRAALNESFSRLAP